MPEEKKYPEDETVHAQERMDPLAPHPRGIARVLVVFTLLVAAFSATYLTPTLAEFRPWTRGSKIPFTTLLDFRPPTRPTLAGVEEREAGKADAEELLAAAPLPESRVTDEEEEAEPDETEADGLDPALRLPREAYAGMTEPIHDPQGVMAHFYARLKGIAEGEPLMARMLLYSDSINGSDRTSRELRQLFGERFGTGGKGFVPISPGWQYQRHKNVEFSHDDWNVFVVNRGERESGRYGLGGVLALNRTPRAWSSFGTTDEGIGSEVAVYRLYYQSFPGGGDLTIAVDEGTPRPLSTDSVAVEDQVYELQLPQGPHELTLGVEEGDVRLYGVVMEREPPGVVVDGLMLVGAFTRVLLNFDPTHWAQQLRLRQPDLITFWLGGNDSVSESVPFGYYKYVRDFTQVLENAREGRPEASCLVISVLDSAEEVEGAIISRPRVRRVVQAQEKAAENAGCAFFNGYEAIGGPGTMRRWRHHRPRLVSVDYRHLTGEGAQVFANLLYKAILHGYDRWLVESTRRPDVLDEDLPPEGTPEEGADGAAGAEEAGADEAGREESTGGEADGDPEGVIQLPPQHP